MKRKIEIDALQSRREFFKKATKAALPVLGTIVLSATPMTKSLAATECNGCADGCYGGCYGSCNGTCSGSCHTGCNTSCYSTCKDACERNCRDICK